ncbi:TlpA family protein disulfide reductase [Armatimonas rosea]|uniref:Thiol-disulfide isomerase/thioredoxin n=1 Tax=Armatimonas rosea TaxID=685828 RepID=A0A7W9SU25_ARMRO|nr:TlpA disulfide reductase family protein [Armatimonas rosea]MBB6052224.1 thiol-disulfide isomerase/thioredoxin [Armatimonas rosea]
MRFSFVAPALTMALAFSLVSSAHAELKLGDAAPALKLSKWVKGTPVTSLAKGKVHVVEFWATWCGPCKVSIPHLTELAKKFQSKADFLGVSINEGSPDYQAKVAKFVKDMGAKMNYNVAIDTASQRGFMSTNWMDAAGQNGIPTAFIIDKAGKVAWIGHPMEMEEPLTKITAGKWDLAAEKKRMDAEQAAEKKMQSFAQKFNPLMLEGNLDEAFKLLDQAVADTPALGPQVAQSLNQIAWMIAEGKQPVPEQLAKLKDKTLPLAQKAVDLTKGNDGMILDTLAFVHYKAGNVKEALALQIKALSKLPAGVDAATKKEMQERLDLYKSKG